jgi:hypothetical protein
MKGGKRRKKGRGGKKHIARSSHGFWAKGVFRGFYREGKESLIGRLLFLFAR